VEIIMVENDIKLACYVYSIGITNSLKFTPKSKTQSKVQL